MSSNYKTIRDLNKSLVKIYEIDKFYNNEVVPYKFEKFKTHKQYTTTTSKSKSMKKSIEREHESKFKTQLCKYHMRNICGISDVKCLNGHNCTFAHGVRDIRGQDAQTNPLYSKTNMQLYNEEICRRVV